MKIGDTVTIRHFATGCLLSTERFYYYHDGGSFKQQLYCIKNKNQSITENEKFVISSPFHSKKVDGAPIKTNDVISLLHPVTESYVSSLIGFSSPNSKQGKILIF